MVNSLLPIDAKRSALFCVLLALFELLTYIGSDIIMPGMINVVTEFHAEPSFVPWSLNAYLLGGVAFQWILGPISDCYGRRPLLLLGSGIFFFSFFFAAWVDNIQLFTLLRFIQGMGLGFVIVVSYPALQEAFNESDAIRLIALIANIALVSPMLGPLLGSILLSIMNWRMLFIVICLLAILCWFGLLRFMPETIGVRRTDGSIINPQPLNIFSMLQTYRNLITHRAFISGCLALGLMGLPLMSWIALSPILIIHNLGLDTLHYALWQLPIFGALILGNITLNFISDKNSVERLLILSCLPIFLGLIIALILTIAFNNLMLLVLGLSLYAFGFGIGNTALYRLTLFSCSYGMGAISAMLGMISVSIFSLGGVLLATNGASNSLSSYIIAVAIPFCFIPFFIRRLIKHTKENPTASPADNH